MIGIELLKTIEKFHKLGYVHLDIKPDNIIASVGAANQLHLIDYGFA